MTDKEFIEKLKSISYITPRSVIQELSQQPQFKAFLDKELGEDGSTSTDEHYLYSYDSELDHELGSRISWFDALCGGLGVVDLTDYEKGEYTFPCEAESFVLDGKRYWILTMTGQGAVSWIMSDERFIKEYKM